LAKIYIHNIDEQLAACLRARAALHARSMEDEVREILRLALSAEPTRGQSLVEAMRTRIEPLAGIELELPAREAQREPPAT
jgi:antitoxin FitA